MSYVAGVNVLISAERTVIAKVRDPGGGIFDVTKGSASGWTCSCTDPSPCLHVGEVRQALAEAIGL